MSDPMPSYDALVAHMSQVSRLAQISGLLAWDQQVNLPTAAHPDRAAHQGLIHSLIQARAADPKVGQWLTELQSASLDEQRAAGVRNHQRTWVRATRVPPDLVERQSIASSAGYAAWHEARKQGDFGLFLPSLTTQVELARELAAAIDPDRAPYDVLVDAYDPGTTTAFLQDTFGRLKAGLGELIDAVGAVDMPPVLDTQVPVAVQRELLDRILGVMGYGEERGRMDDAVHPFTVTLGAGDVRITTRLMDDNLLGGIGATMHEAGHALYELGMPRELLGSGIDGAAGLGVHESQSRLWENGIGRSRAFLGWVADQLEEIAPGTSITADAMYRAANRIVPSPIRIYADEVTYNLHIIVRFELELALIDGSLAPADLPAAWNQAYRDTLGIELRDDLEGVLQDVHWATGSFGYFPTYTLGNLYGAALLGGLERDLPDLWEQVGRAELTPILDWLRDRVHRHGHTLDGADRVREAVGEVDLVDNLLAYLWARHGTLHGVTRPER